MKKVFITYGDAKFTKAKQRILQEADNVKWFDNIKAYGPEDVTPELFSTGLMDIPRGGGLWAWKPDIILSAMGEMDDGDILVYADSGCTLQPCKEWQRIEKILTQYDIIAQSIYQRTDVWTRKEILDKFKTNPSGWERCLQFCATVIILKKTKFSLSLIKEWHDIIIANPEYIKDVIPEEKDQQHKSFFENRHDQSIYSACIYEHLNSNKIYNQWERIEDYDPFMRQAIRATRLRNGEFEKKGDLPQKALKRFIKALLFRPFYTFVENRGYKMFNHFNMCSKL